MKYKLIQKEKTNWITLAIVAGSICAVGILILVWMNNISFDVEQLSNDGGAAVKKTVTIPVPSQVAAAICDKEISGRDPSGEEKKQCRAAGGEWSCGMKMIDYAAPSCPNPPCSDQPDTVSFCTCACPRGRECIKQGDFLVYDFDKCCGGLIASKDDRGTGVCVNCGDGVCGTWENNGNCPQDCPKIGLSPNLAARTACQNDQDCVDPGTCHGCVSNDWLKKQTYSLSCEGIGGSICVCAAGNCKSAAVCGDGKCDADYENVSNCAQDCGKN